jgi:hypothetical protein
MYSKIRSDKDKFSFNPGFAQGFPVHILLETIKMPIRKVLVSSDLRDINLQQMNRTNK